MSSLMKIGGGPRAFGNYGAAQEIAAVKDYVDRELGIKLTIGREASLARAMTDPVAFIGARGAAMAGIKDQVAEKYSETMQRLGEHGLTFAAANEMAMKSSNNFLEELMQELELSSPGMGTVWGSAANTYANNNNRFDLAMGGSELKAHKKQWKAKAQAKKQARRTAKGIANQ